jgi:nitroimidazol reductase NimA-like FMN-containing flavoprotein (pyridoxamine 5'-phosphate oxidase superfamily)
LNDRTIPTRYVWSDITSNSAHFEQSFSDDGGKTWEVNRISNVKGCKMNLTKRAELRRIPDRGSHDWETINQVLDAGFLAHVGFCVDGQPFVIPTLYGRDGERLYLHGSAVSRMLRELETGIPACVTVTLVDGLVLSRPAFDHSMNYRSVVAFGTARKVVDPEEKIKSLRVISEHLIAGRWADVRGPSQKELRATMVLEFAIEEASSKVRKGTAAGRRKRLRDAGMGRGIAA